MAYDLADNAIRDGRFYSILLNYSIITMLADGVECSGRTIRHALSNSGIVAESVRGLEITAGFLFEDNFPLSLPQLRSFIVSSAVSISQIPISAFSGLENLETVEIKGPRPFILGGRAFEDCLSLRNAILTGLTELSGDFHFKGCVSLSSVTMPALAIVPRQSQFIFESCTSLTSLSFGPVPPVAFHPNTFPIPSQISLFLPSGDDYVTYDNSLSVTGDKVSDSFWCSIFLPLNYFKVLINNVLFEGSSLYDAVETSNIEANDIISIEVTAGVFRLQDISDLGRRYPSLVSFVTNARVSIFGDLGTAFTQSPVRSISMETLNSISADAFKNCSFLTSVSFPTATSVGDSAFKGCISLTSISLPKVTVLLGDHHFESCEQLTVLDLRSLSVVVSSSSSIFTGIKSALTLTFPASPPLTFHSASFTGISVVLELPSTAAYEVYDASVSITGDVALDFRWCGIPLVQLYIEVVINQQNAKGATLESAATSVGVNSGSVSSIEIIGGCLRSSEMISLSTRFPALQRFVVSSVVLMKGNEIPTNAFRGAASLSIVVFSVKVSIGESAFEDCSSLSEATFTNVPSVSARAFFGTGLTSISLPQCRRLVGDSIFEGCTSLTSVSLQSLIELNPQASNLFTGCASLTSIFLPSSPPQIFHPNTFADCLSVSLELPSSQAYITYDTSILITGDMADDQRWCGIVIPENRFPQLVRFKVNNDPSRSSRSLKVGLAQVDGSITSLELESGVVSSADFLESKTLLNSLLSLEIHSGTLSVLESSFLSGHPTLQKLIVHGNIEVKPSALQEMAALQILQMRDVKSFPGTGLNGCTALESVDLRSLEAIQAMTFAKLTALTEVIITSARFLYAEAFLNCLSITELQLPKVMELFGDRHFSGCQNLTSISLLHLTFVDQQSANIFADCTSLSSLTLWVTPPERFHPNIFVNRRSLIAMSIILPDIQAWRNYVDQSETINGQLFWYGVPHPTKPATDSMMQSLSETPPESRDATPSESPNETPPESPFETPLESPNETPHESPFETLSESPFETLSESPFETPSESPFETPPESPFETPSGSPGETPAETPSVSIGQSPGDTQAKSHSKTDTPSFSEIIIESSEESPSKSCQIVTCNCSPLLEHPQDPQSEQENNSLGIVIAASVGYLLLVVVAVLAIFFFCKIRELQHRDSASQEMFPPSL
jgi:hypothetical protein